MNAEDHLVFVYMVGGVAVLAIVLLLDLLLSGLANRLAARSGQRRLRIGAAK